MCCDIIVAGEGASFGVPGAGSTATLPRPVGRGLALKMVLTGEPIGAAEALAAGLVAEVRPKGESLVRANELARRPAGRAPIALRQAKTSVRAVDELDHEAHL